MQNTTTSDQQMTDVFGKAQEQLKSSPKISSSKISNRQKAFLTTAAVLLGGGATFAAVELGVIPNPFPETSTEPDPTQPPVNPSDSEPVSTNVPVKHNYVSPVQNGTIKPNDNIDIAGKIDENMTFEQAYEAARTEVGPGGIFSWHGEVYNTYTVEEWQGLSLAQRQEFLSDVGFKPTDINDGDKPVPVEAIYVETIINGRPALGIDDDRDGIADAIVIMDTDRSSLIVIVDNGGDDCLDTVIQVDMATNEIIKQEPLDTPVMTAMSSLEPANWQPDPTVTTNVYTSLEEENVETTDEEEGDEDATDEGYINDAEMTEMDS